MDKHPIALTLCTVAFFVLAGAATAHAPISAGIDDADKQSALQHQFPSGLMAGSKRVLPPGSRSFRVAQRKKGGRKSGACKRRCVQSVSGCQAIVVAMRSGNEGYRDGCKAAVRACMKRC